MNLLVVVPRIVNRVGEYYMFPQGIAYISSSLRDAGFRVHTLNLNHVDQSTRDILTKEIQRHHIDVVLTGGLTGQFGAIRDVMDAAKTVSRDVITVVGGGIITSAPKHAMQALEFADYGVIGEGEIIACDLLETIQSGGDVSNVPGTVFKDGAEFVLGRGQVSHVDLDRLSFPDYEGLGLRDLLATAPNIVGMGEKGTVPIITSRSCPFRCTFCFHSSGQKFRQRSLDSVFTEIDHLIQNYSVRYFAIQDELFSHDADRVRMFCERIKPYGVNWWAQFRVTDVTEDLINDLKQAGCSAMGLGIESGDDRILRSMRKGTTVQANERALEIAYRGGMGVQGAVILGDTAETIETARNSIEWWKRNARYELQLSMIVTYPGTEIYKAARKKGIIRDPVQFIRDGCPVVKLSDMSDEEYRWVVGQVLSLPRSIQDSPSESSTTRVDYENAQIDISGRCVSCGADNKWEGVRLFITESLMCSKCGRRHTSRIPGVVVSTVRQGVNRLLARYGKVAFWGINSYFYAFFEMAGFGTIDNVVIVDDSEARQGVNVGGKEIQTLDAINQQEIPCVVVTVVQYFASLKGPIEKAYPGVENVLSIANLLKEQRAVDAR